MRSTCSKMSCGTNQFMLALFVLLSTTTLMRYSYASSSLSNNTNQHFAGNNNTGLVTLDQLSAAAVMDLRGSISQGSYHVTVKLGPAAMEYFFLIDTGSDVTWVNCDLQSQYHYPHPAYRPDPVHSTVFCFDPVCSFVDQPADFPCSQPTNICYYVVGYVDGTSTTGVMIKDALSLPFRNVDPSLLPPSINIGCGVDQIYPSRPDQDIDEDGTLGLSKKSRVSIIAQLANKGIIRPVFGHCMSRPANGYFFIGAGKVLPPAITWAPMVTLARNEDLYSPGPADLVFDGRLIGVWNLVTVFDSGSTVTYFQSVPFQVTLDLVRRNLVGAPLAPKRRSNYPNCWRARRPIASVDEVAAYFRTIALIFPAANNVRFELPPHAYLTVEARRGYEPAGDVCFAILDASEHGVEEMNIIGDISFQDKLVIYDLDRERIGWAPSNCQDRRMNDQKYRHMNDRKYRRRDLSRHRFSSNIPVRRQPPPAN